MIGDRNTWQQTAYSAGERYRQLKGKLEGDKKWTPEEERQIAVSAALEKGLQYPNGTVDPKLAECVRMIGNRTSTNDAIAMALNKTWETYRSKG